MPDPVNLADEFAPPDTKAAGAATETTSEHANLLAEFEPPPKKEQYAVVNDAVHKARQWTTASPEERPQLLDKWVGATNPDDAPSRHLTEIPGTLRDEKQFAPLATLPRIDNEAVQAMSRSQSFDLVGMYNGIAPIISSFTSPMSLETMGTFGALSSVAKGAGPAAPLAEKALTALKVYFAADMAKGAGEAAGKASVETNTENVTSALVHAGLAALAGHSAVEDVATPQGEPVNVPKEESPAEVPLRQEQPENGPKKVDGSESDKAPVALADEFEPPKSGSEEHAVITDYLNQGDEAPAVKQPKPSEPAPEADKAAPPAGGATSIKNAVVDEERASRGLPPAMEPAAREFGTAWDDAAKRIEADPKAPEKLVDELLDKPRALSDTENAMLLRHQIDLQNQFDKVASRVIDGAEDATPETLAADKIQLAGLSDDLLDLYNAGKQAGTEQGRGLNSRKMLANEDYSLARMITKRRAVNEGETLTPKQAAETQELHAKIAATQKAFDEYVAKTEAGKPVTATTNKARNVVSRFISERADEARARIKERLTSGRVQSGLDPVDLADHALVGADYIAKGVEKFADWSEAMLKEFGDRIKPHLKDIFGKSEEAKADSDNQEIRQQVEKRTTALESQIATLKKKLETGDTSPAAVKANRPSVEEIEKLEQERDSLRNDLSDMREREAKVAQLKDAIAEKEQKIAEGDLAAKEQPVNRPAQPEIETLKQERDALNDQIDELRHPTKTPTELAAGSLDRRIAELERQIKTGEIFPEGKKPKTQDRALKSKQDRLDQLKFERENMRETIQPSPDPRIAKTPEEIKLGALKTRLKNSAEKYRERTASGDFGPRPKPKPTALDSEGLRLKAQNERAKQEFQTALIKDRLENRTDLEKAQDTLVRWRRGFLLSGPVTLAKLTGAAVLRAVTTPLEELTGAALGKVVPSLMERAPRHGGFNAEAEAKAITSVFTKGMDDAFKTLTSGKSDLDVLYGKGVGGKVRQSDVIPQSVIDFFGHLHGALKAPIKRAEFERSMVKRTAVAIRNGVDVGDPLVQQALSVAAYKDANRAIFMQDNIVSKAWNTGLGGLENINIDGKRSAVGKAVGTTLRTLMPIVKVPTNIVAEAAEYTIGSVTGSVQLARAWKAGMENLKPEQADAIARQLKKGSLGAAALLLGYYNKDNFGGFYQQGEKRKKSDVEVGAARIDGQDIGKSLIHSSLVETIQLGATISRIQEQKVKHGSNSLPDSIGLATLGLAEELPFVRTPIEIGKLFDKNTRPYTEGELVKGLVVPAAVSQTAQYFDRDERGDPIKRKATTIPEHIESGIPGLREKLPVKR